MNYPHPIIAREGWPFIGIAVVLAVLIQSLGGFAWSWPFWVLLVFVVQFFRDPPRNIPTQANAVLSPADGRIVAVETVHDQYADREALKISVFMNVFNAHSQRSPVDGTIRTIQYFPGAFLNAELDKASLQNERNALVFDLPTGHIISCVQVAGLVARRILCYARVGETLTRGQRYGFIRFGSRLDVYLPVGSRPRVAIGEKVYASSTILADLAELPTASTTDFTAATAAAVAAASTTTVTPVAPVAATPDVADVGAAGVTGGAGTPGTTGTTGAAGAAGTAAAGAAKPAGAGTVGGVSDVL